jgi:hypothetical protein
MNDVESRMATLFVACLALFILGVILLLLAFSPLTVEPKHEMRVAGLILLFGSPLLFGIFWLIGALARSAVIAQGRSGDRIRFVAKVHKAWVTDNGHVVPSDAAELESPRFHVVLMSPDGRTFECETAPEVMRECIEGSWGWAEIQGDWLGSFVRDPRDVMQYSGH